jgi:hypothetical protein
MKLQTFLHFHVFAHISILLSIILLPNVVIALSTNRYDDPIQIILFSIFIVIFAALPILLVAKLRHFFIFYIPFVFISPF